MQCNIVPFSDTARAKPGNGSSGMTFLLLLLLLPPAALPCPAPCACEGGVVDCAGQRLGQVPRDVPSDATTLLLGSNNLTDLWGQLPPAAPSASRPLPQPAEAAGPRAGVPQPERAAAAGPVAQRLPHPLQRRVPGHAAAAHPAHEPRPDQVHRGARVRRTPPPRHPPPLAQPPQRHLPRVV
ncbi:hypothetical protein CEXT_779571 [Caerostris extrusa]|uniref:LRRNT domain-containing protein n=1 Tax=Caerostris extrusa TaxID=172846 RepID=A0AAV4XXL1_CAEEX|nr:hypothetical protein CEXT_779571 [Caerostris extrusa]